MFRFSKKEDGSENLLKQQQQQPTKHPHIFKAKESKGKKPTQKTAKSCGNKCCSTYFGFAPAEIPHGLDTSEAKQQGKYLEVPLLRSLKEQWGEM